MFPISAKNDVEFLSALRQDPELKESVIFVFSTSEAEKDKHQAYRYNVAGYIVKSATQEGFVNVAGLLDHYSKVVELP